MINQKIPYDFSSLKEKLRILVNFGTTALSFGGPNDSNGPNGPNVPMIPYFWWYSSEF